MNTEIFKIQERFLMLALDHRQTFFNLLNSEDPESVFEEDVVDLKREIIEALADQFSGLLIDPEYGLLAIKNMELISPYLLCIEKSGYAGNKNERYTRVQHSSQVLKTYGASGIKLLLYFDPFSKSAEAQLELGKKILGDAHDNGLPFFLELLTYEKASDKSQPGAVPKLVRTFSEFGCIPDVWKLEYPGDIESCREVTTLVKDKPWILLSRGVSFKEFTRELEDAMQSGADGFLAGRALWQEAAHLKGREREEFLKNTLPQRFQKLSQIVFG